jgi:hypothetical protein
MHELREIAGPDNCYYQFTDSLTVNREGLDRLGEAGKLDPGRLGACKVTGPVDVIDIRGPGWIRFGDTLHASGIGNEAEVVGQDKYRIEHQMSPLGMFGPSGLNGWHKAIVEVHFPPPETWGTFKASGWVEPPVLPLQAERKHTGPSGSIDPEAVSRILDRNMEAWEPLDPCAYGSENDTVS